MSRRPIAKNITSKIITCALNMALQDGINHISTRDAAKKLGITEPVIFFRFKTKKDLIDSCFNAAWDVLDRLPTVEDCLNKDGVNEANKQLVYLRANEIMKHRKELAFLVQYEASPLYYDRVLLLRRTEERRKRVIASLLAYQTPDPDLIMDKTANTYVVAMVSLYYHLSMGHYHNDPDTIAALVNQVFFGIYGRSLI
jgi:AcrR family transcriptional regulator